MTADVGIAYGQKPGAFLWHSADGTAHCGLTGGGLPGMTRKRNWLLDDEPPKLMLRGEDGVLRPLGKRAS